MLPWCTATSFGRYAVEIFEEPAPTPQLQVWIMTFTEVAVTTVLFTILATFIYNFAVGDRDRQLRSFMRKSHSKWRNRRFVRAFVGAVRGDAATGDARSAMRTLGSLQFVLALCFVIGATTAQGLLLTGREIVDRASYEIELREPSSESEQPKSSTDSTRDVRETINSARSILSNGQYVVFSLMGMALVLATMGAYILIFVEPFTSIQRQFAFSIERFTARIQGFATPVELLDLTIAELAVRDERSLRSYLEISITIAERYALLPLANSIDLWSEETPQR